MQPSLGQGTAGSTARVLPKLWRWLALAILLYLFLLSIELLGGAFKLFGKGLATSLIETTSNPFVSLFVGILATSLVQSSSTVTSLVVGLVAAGGLTIEGAVPLVLGANIGTSVTSTLVALGHATRRSEFQHALTAATVHDFFNILAVTLLFPLELATGFLHNGAAWLSGSLLGSGGATFKSPLKMIVKPVEKALEGFVVDHSSSKPLAATILVVIALVLLFFSLRKMVVLLKGVMLGRVENVMGEQIFARPWLALLLGVLVTVAVQSSSITTSVAVPLVAAGLLTLEQIFPFVLGANIGTTITALLASLVTGDVAAVTVALCHTLFNIAGVILLWPLRGVPIWCARKLALLTQRSSLYPIAYVVGMFFILPTLLILISR